MTNGCGVLVGVAVGEAGMMTPHMLWRSETERHGAKSQHQCGAVRINSCFNKGDMNRINDILLVYNQLARQTPYQYQQVTYRKRFLYITKVQDYCPLLANKFNALPARINPHWSLLSVCLTGTVNVSPVLCLVTLRLTSPWPPAFNKSYKPTVST